MDIPFNYYYYYLICFRGSGRPQSPKSKTLIHCAQNMRCQLEKDNAPTLKLLGRSRGHHAAETNDPQFNTNINGNKLLKMYLL